MKPIQRTDIIDYMTYIDHRDALREKVMIEKNRRRIHVGDDLTFLFENRDTMRYQIQEMMRIERLVREEDILHEIETYNAVLGGDGELGCTLLIEIDDVDERKTKLRQWINLPHHIYARLDDGSKVYAKFDDRQVDVDRLSAVQYIKFNTAGKVPVAMGTDLPELILETELTDDQKAALSEDLVT